MTTARPVGLGGDASRARESGLMQRIRVLEAEALVSEDVDSAQ